MTGPPVEILLVEDNPGHAEMTVRTLRKHNITNQIQIAKDGAEAIALLFSDGNGHSNAPKIILLDLNLPKIDGIEVLRRIKEDPRTKTVPVVVLTSSHEENDLRQCYALGVNSYIVKPVDFQQFSEAIRLVGLYWALLNRLPT
jgi:two-component system response regulator